MTAFADHGAPLRGPHQEREGHRAAQPSPQGLRPEPAVVRDRRAGLRAAGLDPAARPGRGSPPLGAQAPAAAALRGRRTTRLQLPPPAAPPRRTLALGSRHHRCGHPPASPAVRLTSRNRCYDQERTTPGAVEPRHPERQPGPGHARRPKINPSQTPQTRTPASRNIEASNRGPRNRSTNTPILVKLCLIATSRTSVKSP